MIELLREEGRDDAVREAMYDKSVQIGRIHNVNPTVLRGTAIQRHGCNAPARTPSEYWRRNLYLPFIVHLITELTDRLVMQEHRFIAQYMIPARVEALTDEKLAQLYLSYGGDIPASEPRI